ncbi:MAG: VWA domain-containing protein [Clostridiales bacterium]|nr:VWA domain-containing protein [Clostridiales bacterium]
MLKDTDQDGISDYDEYQMKSNPCVNDANTQVVKNYDNKSFNIGVLPVGIKVELDATYAQHATFSVEVSENKLLDCNIPGYLGNAYDLTIDGGFNNARLTMVFDSELLKTSDFMPAIFYFNEETQMLEEVDGQTISGDEVTVNLKHFSTYVLLNKTEFSKVWKNEILAPNTQSKRLRIGFVVDTSGSMNSSKMNTAKTVLRNFVNDLGDNDEATIIRFSKNSTVVVPLTSSKESLINGINTLSGSGLTSIYSGIDSALQQLSTPSTDSFDTIVVLTDGYDEPSVSYEDAYSSLLTTAVDKKIIIYTVGISTVDENLLKRVASETGGKYYLASVVSDLQDCFDDLKKETIDYTTDSNQDGISDYYTKQLCNGTLRAGVGSRVFGSASYEQVQANNDYDGDGLLNGDEIKITKQGDRVYVKYICNPTRKDSDLDSYSDAAEVNSMGTDPLDDNMVYSPYLADLLINDSNYVSTKYRDIYRNDWSERASAWIGNNIFGTSYDQTRIYESALIDYFTDINVGLKEESKKEQAQSLAYEFSKQVSSAIGSYCDYYGRINGSASDILGNLEKTVSTLEGKWLTASVDNFASIEEYYKYTDDLYAEYRQAQQAIPGLKKQLKINDKFKTGTRVTNVLTIVTAFIDVGMDCKANYDEYLNFKADLDVIQKNIYILDLIISETEDSHLRDAAINIKKALAEDLNNGTTTFWSSSQFKTGTVVNSFFGNLAHTVIALIPYGCYVELARGILDYITNISGVSYECVKLYSISSAAEIMAKSFRNRLNADSLTDKNGYHCAPSIRVIYNNPGVALNKMINLAYARIAREKQMKKANEANTWILEWYFRDFKFSSDTCDSNIANCDIIIKSNIERLQILSY